MEIFIGIIFTVFIRLIIDVFLYFKKRNNRAGRFIIVRDEDEPPYIFLELFKSIEEIENFDEVIVEVKHRDSHK